MADHFVSAHQVYKLKDEVYRLRQQLERADEEVRYWKDEAHFWRDEATRLQGERMTQWWGWRPSRWSWFVQGEDIEEEIVHWDGDVVWQEAIREEEKGNEEKGKGEKVAQEEICNSNRNHPGQVTIQI